MSWALVALAVVLVPVPAVANARQPICGDIGKRDTRLPPLNIIAAVAVVLGSLGMVPMPWSLVVAAIGGYLAHRYMPTEFSRDEERRALALARSLPDAIDLLAAVLRAGLTDTDAVALVADAVPGQLGELLSRVARHRAFGATAAQAWRTVRDEPALAELSSVMARNADTGSPVAPILDRVAADARRDYYSTAQGAARAAAVRAVIPLAACFLPAFVLLGVVPIVASLVSELSF